MRWIIGLLFVAGAALAADAVGLTAVVHKPSVVVHSAADFKAPEVTTLKRNAKVQVAGQEGLWYRLALDGGASGYVRVNEVRVAQTGKTKPETMQVLLSGKSGRGRVSETAGVRGLDESELRSASFDAAQLATMESYRATPQAGAAWASQHGLSGTQIAWADEASKGGNVSQAKARTGSSVARSLLGSLGGGLLGSAADVGEAAVPKSEEELTQEELALGPLIAGRVLGARPLLADPQAQQRINGIGRWLASNTARPELPWTFGVIDSAEINAFAAPGGYVLVTSGLYDLAGSDAELAAVLSHEINHIVHRDHYDVIRKQQMQATGMSLVSSPIDTGGGLAGSLARGYVEKHGAAILSTSLDRGAEYRADELAQVYLARSGMNPLALYAILQRMSALGSASSGLAQLYKSHPQLDDRLDKIDQRGYAKLEPYITRD